MAAMRQAAPNSARKAIRPFGADGPLERGFSHALPAPPREWTRRSARGRAGAPCRGGRRDRRAASCPRLSAARRPGRSVSVAVLHRDSRRQRDAVAGGRHMHQRFEAGRADVRARRAAGCSCTDRAPDRAGSGRPPAAAATSGRCPAARRICAARADGRRADDQQERLFVERQARRVCRSSGSVAITAASIWPRAAAPGGGRSGPRRS